MSHRSQDLYPSRLVLAAADSLTLVQQEPDGCKASNAALRHLKKGFMASSVPPNTEATPSHRWKRPRSTIADVRSADDLYLSWVKLSEVEITKNMKYDRERHDLTRDTHHVPGDLEQLGSDCMSSDALS